MSFLSILDSIILGPLKLLFEIIFNVAYSVTSDVTISIIALSLVMNILVLPLYRSADAMQEKTRETEKRLKPAIDHIKKTFSGNERMMMLQTFYRQNHYSPFSVFSGSISLLLEIPFFIAAYQFLSDIAILDGASFWLIGNFAEPDQIIKIGSITINILPLLMTAINIIASVLFLKGANLQSKIQLYGIAVVFLVLLYNSPSGLVFYWTLNNIFSLVKTIFYKIKNPRKAINALCSILGTIFFVLVLIFSKTWKVTTAGSIIFGLMQLPLLLTLLKNAIENYKLKNNIEPKVYTPNKKLFLACSIFLTLLLGILIPSSCIASSPQEFIDVNMFVNPTWYIVNCCAISAGLFLVWISVFYWLANDKGKVIFNRVLVVICGIATINYMLFGLKLGTLSSTLQFVEQFYYTYLEHTLNVIAILGLIVFLCYAIRKWYKPIMYCIIIANIAICGMAGINITQINSSVAKVEASTGASQEIPTFTLSKNGQNVVVLFLDRAIGPFIPSIFKEDNMLYNEVGLYDKTGMVNPNSLEYQFQGFTYYPNTMSFADHTNIASTSMLGGYEYTPVEMNIRMDKKLEEKQNEANLLLPRIFTEQCGYDDAKAFDPVYAGYQWLSDTTIYDEYEKLEAKNIIGTFMDDKQRKGAINNRYRNFFCYSLLKCSPVFIQSVLYDDGFYNNVTTKETKELYSSQVHHSMSTSINIQESFMQNYNVLEKLNDMTQISNDDKKHYVFMCNNITHEPMLVDEANGYIPSYSVDNTEYDEKYKDRFVIDDATRNRFKLYESFTELNIVTAKQMKHYQTNVVALKKLGQWFNYLRQDKELYNNTKIIIVSDHAYYLDLIQYLNKSDKEYNGDLVSYMPLLMVKDFNAPDEPLKVDSQFMTNADVPTIALQNIEITNPYSENGVILSAVNEENQYIATNPYTKQGITNKEKYNHKQYISRSSEYMVGLNNGNQFAKGLWLSIGGIDTNGEIKMQNTNVWDPKQWVFYKKNTVLTKHEDPK